MFEVGKTIFLPCTSYTTMVASTDGDDKFMVRRFWAGLGEREKSLDIAGSATALKHSMLSFPKVPTRKGKEVPGLFTEVVGMRKEFT